MSTIVPPFRELRPDDVLNMPDDVRYELVDGRLVESNTSTESSYIAGNVAHLLKNHCDSPPIGLIFPEHGYACFPGKPNRMRWPDVSVVLAARITPELFREGFQPIRPDLAIEVVSPGDRVYDLLEKLQDYRDAGIPLIWLVYPPSKTVEIIRLDGTRSELGPDDELTGEAVLPSFRYGVADFFIGLPEANPETEV